MLEGVGRIVAAIGSIAAGAALWIALMTPGVVPAEWHDPVLVVAFLCIAGGGVLLVAEIGSALLRVYRRWRHSPAAIKRRYFDLWGEAMALLDLNWEYPTLEMERQRDRLFSRVQNEIRTEDPGVHQIDLTYRLGEADARTQIGGVRDLLHTLIQRDR